MQVIRRHQVPDPAIPASKTDTQRPCYAAIGRHMLETWESKLMPSSKGAIPGGASAPAFDRKTTEAVIVAIENQIALLDAQLVRLETNDGQQQLELANKRVRLQSFLDDYVATSEDHHRRLEHGSLPPAKYLPKE